MDVGLWTLDSGLLLALLHGTTGDADEFVLLAIGLAVGLAVMALTRRRQGGKGKGGRR